MPVSVTMPRLGESVTEGTVTRWLKQEGERVELDEPLLEVSTDKVDTEIPSPAAGVLQKILVAEDETAEVGSELAIIASDGDPGGAAPAAAQATPAATQAAPPPPPAAQLRLAGSRPAPAPRPRGRTRRALARRRDAGAMPALGERRPGHGHPLARAVGDNGARRAAARVSTDKVDTEIPSPVAGVAGIWCRRTRRPPWGRSSP
jgi:2-oxoglutarate dehydrogenase E2 component (dihydrolipoamide succinyltransferase)